MGKSSFSAKALDEHRDINLFSGWWDYQYEHTIEEAKKMGIEVRSTDITFSGFCSQGDGASFTGKVTDLHKFLEANNLLADYPRVVQLIGMGHAPTLELVRTNQYYSHQNTVSANGDFTWFESVVNCPSQLHQTIIATWDAELHGEMDRLGLALQTTARAMMVELYLRLEKEYEHQTSDANVAETMAACGLEEDEAMEELSA